MWKLIISLTLAMFLVMAVGVEALTNGTQTASLAGNATNVNQTSSAANGTTSTSSDNSASTANSTIATSNTSTANNTGAVNTPSTASNTSTANNTGAANNTMAGTNNTSSNTTGSTAEVNGTTSATNTSQGNLTATMPANATTTGNMTSGNNGTVNGTSPETGNMSNMTMGNETGANATKVNGTSGVNSTTTMDNSTNVNTTSFNMTTAPSSMTNMTGQNGTDTKNVTACQLPSELSGVWHSTIWGDVLIADGYIHANATDLQVTLSCYAKDTNTGNYIFRQKSSSTSNSSTNGTDLFTCIKFERRNLYSYHVQILTERNDELAGKEPVATKNANTSSAFTDLCNAKDNNITEGELIATGKEVAGALGCPQLLKGIFNVTYTGTTSSRCPKGASMKSCDESKTLMFDYTSCGGTAGFSGKNNYVCVSGGSNVVTTFRESSEENDFTPFACLRVTEKSNTSAINAVFTGHGCGGRWAMTTSATSKVTYDLEKTDDCPVKKNKSGAVTLKLDLRDTIV